MNDHNITRRGGLADFDLYPYNPSNAAGWTFVVIFGIAAAVHFILMFPLRGWFFIPFILGCIGEAFGYYGRAWSHNNIRLGSPYLLQLMLILGCAPLLAASVYMTLGRFVRALHAQEHTIMRSTWITKIYVVIDIGSFICQMMGSAMQSSGDAAGVKTGREVVIGGLGVQLVALAWFLFECSVLHRRLNRTPTPVSKEPSVRWRGYLWTLHSVSILIFVRSLYRLVEFTSGTDSVAATEEVFLYVFDAALLAIAAGLLAVVHPARLVKTVGKLGLNTVDDGAFMLESRI